MIYAGLISFFIAVASGLCGFSGMLPPLPTQVAQMVFISSMVLATLTFTLRLLLLDEARRERAREPAPDTHYSHPHAAASIGAYLDSSPVEQVLFKAPDQPLDLIAHSLL